MFSTLTYLKENLGFEIIEMQHAYRVNGTVDIFKNRSRLYVKPEGKEYFDIQDIDIIDFIKKKVSEYPDQPSFGNKHNQPKHGMSYKEFKHRMNMESQNPDSFNGADYHWNNNVDKKSDNHLYFIFHNRTVKIGQTLNIYNRIAGLKTGFSNDFYVITFYNKGFLEQLLHKAFSDYRKRGEWFDDCEVIRSFIKKYWNSSIGQSIKSEDFKKVAV